MEFDEDKLKLAVEEYFCQVIDSGERLTALDYHQQHGLEFDTEAWLYQVIGGYQGLSMEEQDYFAIETSGKPHPAYSGNYIIRDVELGLRHHQFVQTSFNIIRSEKGHSFE